MYSPEQGMARMLTQMMMMIMMVVMLSVMVKIMTSMLGSLTGAVTSELAAKFAGSIRVSGNTVTVCAPDGYDTEFRFEWVSGDVWFCPPGTMPPSDKCLEVNAAGSFSISEPAGVCSSFDVYGDGTVRIEAVYRGEVMYSVEASFSNPVPSATATGSVVRL